MFPTSIKTSGFKLGQMLQLAKALHMTVSPDLLTLPRPPPKMGLWKREIYNFHPTHRVKSFPSTIECPN